MHCISISCEQDQIQMFYFYNQRASQQSSATYQWLVSISSNVGHLHLRVEIHLLLFPSLCRQGWWEDVNQNPFVFLSMYLWVVEKNILFTSILDGKLFSGGVEIALQGVKIDQIAVGKEHCLALTTDGKVLSWGSGM